VAARRIGTVTLETLPRRVEVGDGDLALGALLDLLLRPVEEALLGGAVALGDVLHRELHVQLVDHAQNQHLARSLGDVLRRVLVADAQGGTRNRPLMPR